MKAHRRLLTIIMALVMVINLTLFGTIQVFAHSAMLNVNYDNCIPDKNGDGIDEMWYSLCKQNVCRHISHEEETIKYYFADSAEGSTYTWTTDVSASVAQEIKDAYAESMKKWNNVYFYSYDESGVLIKHKIINVVEGTETDHNLIIYPVAELNGVAETLPTGYKDVIGGGTINHYHYSKWKMNVNISRFYVNGSYNQEYVNLVRERNGAHELAHVLGLRDVDSSNLCNANESESHHHELLMGYGSPMVDRAFNITYKDIAGVAITRGFHTDSDHKWLNRGLQSDGKYKLVCSICNGVKNVSSLSGYTYQTYGACNNNHSLSGGNMMAVASYGTKDYYKCKYCRYVAPFDSIVTQNYTKTYCGDNTDKYVNNVDGLEYTFYQQHTHSYRYKWLSEVVHERTCYDCGEVSTAAHVVPHGAFSSPISIAICLECRGRASIGVLNSLAVNELPHSSNGSYILPNGIIVLVDEDMEAYKNGTLVFHVGELS